MGIDRHGPKLIFLCGKMAAGKSTLARDLAERENAVLVVQDQFLDSLYPGEITDIPEFVKYSSRLKSALEPHVCALLAKGMSVVLDFPANTKIQRAWFRGIFERANVEHEMHFVDASASCASGSSGSGAGICLLALPGQPTPSSRRSPRTFSLQPRMNGSMSSVTSAPR